MNRCSFTVVCNQLGRNWSGEQIDRSTTERGGMAFIMEFAENWIRRSMEDPEERDRKFREHVYSTKAKCDKLKADWANPVKPYGSWNTDKNNLKFLMDLKLGRMSGRTDPVEQAAIDISSRS